MARLLARLGRFSARHRWVVIIGWLALLVTFGVVALSGMRFSAGGFDVPGTSSSKAMAVLEEEFPTDDDAPAERRLQFVVKTEHGAITDPVNLTRLTEALEQIRELDGVSTVSDPLDPARPFIAEDLTTAVASIAVEADADNEAVPDELEAIADDLRNAGLTAEIGGTLESEVPEILGPSEIVGAILAFLVLLLTYGSLVAAGANMLGALVGVAVGILGVLAFSAINPIGSLTPILAVMLGLAVGIDYCLFIIARFRSELRAEANVTVAIGRAIGTAGSAVVFAGATVIIALTGLTVVGITFLGEMGLAAAFAVAVAMVMSLTLVPAMLSLMGTRALSRRDRRIRAQRLFGSLTPDTATRTDSGLIAGWARVVTRHRVLSLLGGTALLVLIALPMFSMQTTLSTPGGEDPKSTQRAAYDLVAAKFGGGAQDPLVVLVRHDAVEATLPTVLDRLSSLEDVAMVIPAGVSPDGDTAMLTVMAEHGPLDERTTQLVKEIRAESGEVAGAQLLVTGATALGLDSDEQLQSALALYITLIVGLSLILLVVLFRSLLIPLVATLGFLLSLGAGLGATVAIFQWGWLDPIVSAPQGNPLLSLLPIVVTGILFGLAMDYQVFLVSRMHEAYTRGLPPLEAIRAGFRRSAGIVVAAAAIMTAVFGGFAMSPSSLVGSIALALTVGVLADAFVVRMVLVPAALSLLGRAAWWIPVWLDRILPTIDVEGSTLDGRTGDPELPPLAAAEMSGANR